jgi:hypothetical protein
MKTLDISIPAGHVNPAEIDDKVLNPVAPSGSLGFIAAAILAGAITEQRVVVDVLNRKVYGDDAAAGQMDDATALVASAGAVNLGSFAMDDDTRKSSSFSRVGSAGYTIAAPAGETLAEQVLSKPVKPTFSLSSLVGAIEDATATGGLLAGQNVLIFADQAAAQVAVVAFDTPEHLTAALVGISAPQALDQYLQVPATNPANPTALAFE